MHEVVLKPAEIVRTAGLLCQRIDERFPDSGLAKVARDLKGLAAQARAEAAAIRRPIYSLRFLVGLLVAVIFVLIGAAAVVAWQSFRGVDHLTPIDLLTAVEAGTNEIVLIGIAVLFLANLERRIKRRRALKALHQLRSMAHVIDMHQLSKDPGRYRQYRVAPTPSSPETVMTLAELARYLDYCSEMLSITGKIAAIYIQHFDDDITMASASEIEALVTGLARKIWQKIMIADSTQTALSEANDSQ